MLELNKYLMLKVQVEFELEYIPGLHHIAME